jgi:hypothetical protein
MEIISHVLENVSVRWSKFKLYSVVAICASVFPFHVVLVLVLSLAG